jgi:hypothetical protein
VAGDTSLLRLQLPQRLDLPPPFPSPASPTAP